jgi:hypothetical protein
MSRDGRFSGAVTSLPRGIEDKRRPDSLTAKRAPRDPIVNVVEATGSWLLGCRRGTANARRGVWRSDSPPDMVSAAMEDECAISTPAMSATS